MLIRSTLLSRVAVVSLVTENGDALFFDDIYGHDQRLEAALNSRRPRTAPAKVAAAP